jgi:hypothetical protein
MAIEHGVSFPTDLTAAFTVLRANGLVSEASKRRSIEGDCRRFVEMRRDAARLRAPATKFPTGASH